MLKKHYFMCKCYFTNNIYIKEVSSHFNYVSPQHFIQMYEKKLHSNGFKNDIMELLSKVHEEIETRKKHEADSHGRKLLIQENYKPLYPEIFSLSTDYFTEHFLSLWRIASDATSLEQLLEFLKTHKERLYSFPLFSSNFCDSLVEEVKHFESSPFPKGRPNTMNKYGVKLSELGFDSFIHELRTKYLTPLTRLLYPDWGGDDLDSHKAFVVAYKVGEDVDLDYHYDNAEITLNVSLNDSYSDGELYFGSMRFEESSLRFGYEHNKGTALLHRGQQMHGALPISDGERYNLIIWLRSSNVRNKVCPMCDGEPKLVPVADGTGDGFTQTTVELCTVL